MNSTSDSGKRFLVIWMNHPNAGYFAYVNFVLNQILYAESHGLTPVVFFGARSGDGRNAFYDAAYGENMWEYYFEPVGGCSYNQLESRLKDPADSLNEKDIVRLSDDELWRIHGEDLNSIYVYPHGVYRSKSKYDEAWYRRQRLEANRLICKYIRVKPHVLEKVEDFCGRHFEGEHVLGIHMRGTDKGIAGSDPSLMRIIKPHRYFRHIDDYTDRHGPCKIFVATDQQQYLAAMKARYGKRVLCYDAIRSLDFRNTFQKPVGNNYKKGEDVLIDCLLLSHCRFLLKCTSAVGEFAMYFNPDLRCVDLNHETGWFRSLWKYQVGMRARLSMWYQRRVNDG